MRVQPLILACLFAQACPTAPIAQTDPLTGATTAPLSFLGWGSADVVTNRVTLSGWGASTPADAPAIGFQGWRTPSVSAPPLAMSGWGDPTVKSDTIAFDGYGQARPIAADALSFSGVGQTSPVNADPLEFVGLRQSDAIATTPLSLSAWGQTHPIISPALALTGLRDTPPPNDPLSFIGWGQQSFVATAALSLNGWRAAGASTDRLRFVGVRPPDPILTTEDFSGGAAGWQSSDGPDALNVDRTGALCLIDNEPTTLSIDLPPRFLGDWGGPDGSLAFRVYYLGTTQWPVVVTLHSPSGTATWAESLNSYNDLPFEDLSRPLAAIWWQEEGDWDSIISNVTRVEIELDIKDGNDAANEICVDDFVLTRAPTL